MAAATLESHIRQLRAAKVEINLKPIASAPMLKLTRFNMDGSFQVSKLENLLCEKLRSSTVYLYCQEAFQPAGDEYISDLHECFGKGGKLYLSYSVVPAFS
eukprot:gnl/MRDRNA2_/MRDRNA2_113591_c0_seq1.p1 gnl/MRDRNA2_/MRDRNA2_113591_c0~~gnl/MRDRNA2_/MRDRNA2_113591_c0_seq1.p1  ORF type:complete len:101 (+),score=16.43 gnl/MRDRNA2_/MRDRNA2_113591_c0_seq1:81-383(+)